MRALVPEGGADVVHGGLAPAGGRLLAMEVVVLLAVEQVEAGAGHAGQPAEVADRRGVHVDATEAAECGRDVADAGGRPVEAARAPAETSEEVGVEDGCVIVLGKHGAGLRKRERQGLGPAALVLDGGWGSRGAVAPPGQAGRAVCCRVSSASWQRGNSRSRAMLTGVTDRTGRPARRGSSELRSTPW